jgi:NDP-sugar pyrophosphorylase family protein
MRPTSAVLLAAGRGKRQRPFTDQTPKPLLPVGKSNSLDMTLRATERAGVRRVCVVTHHLEAQIHSFVSDGFDWGMQAAFSHQAALHGSGDGLLSVLTSLPDWVDRSAPVLVTATDYLLPENALADLVTAHETQGCDITVSLKECPPEELSARSSVDLDQTWRVQRIVEKPAPGEAPSRFTAALIYILPPEIWVVLPDLKPSARGELELPAAVNLLLESGMTAFGLLQPTPGEWSPDLMNNPVVSI